MKGFDEEVDELLLDLEEEIDVFDSILDEISVLRGQKPDGKPDVDFMPAIQVVAEFLFDISAYLDPELQKLIRQYRGYWHGENGLSLDELNSALQALRGLYTESQILIDMQYLTGAEPWETQQDGVGFYLCIALRREGISGAAIKDSLRRCSKTMEPLINAKSSRS